MPFDKKRQDSKNSEADSFSTYEAFFEEQQPDQPLDEDEKKFSGSFSHTSTKESYANLADFFAVSSDEPEPITRKHFRTAARFYIRQKIYS